jgi:hypothetical protein
VYLFTEGFHREVMRLEGQTVLKKCWKAGIRDGNKNLRKIEKSVDLGECEHTVQGSKAWCP